MATITRFEDLEIWQLAMSQCRDFDLLIETTSLAKDFELRNQMNASSGSVMDCIAEGFERSGNSEFKNLLVIAKGSNGEFRSQLYRCLNRKYITPEKFNELYEKNVMLGKKIMTFIQYLQQTEFKGHRYKKVESSNQPQTSNLKLETKLSVIILENLTRMRVVSRSSNNCLTCLCSCLLTQTAMYPRL
jgi:four helix bundle protein